MCQSAVPNSRPWSARGGTMKERQGSGLVSLLQGAKRLSADYRDYVRHRWPRDAETLSPAQLTLCTDELLLIVKNLARIVAHVAHLEDPSTSPPGLEPFETALMGPVPEPSSIPAPLGSLSDSARSLHLLALRLTRLPQ
jgi:hypothetical protein